MAAERHGRCLSPEYVNTKTKMLWECIEGHQWEATPNNVRKGTWCPICGHASPAEEFTRHVLQEIFEVPFIKIRPDWNVTARDTRLELDGYNEKLSLAFEHHGLQHYEVDGYFNKTLEDLERRVEYDNIKKINCNNRGVRLIEIPQLDIYDLERSLELILCEIIDIAPELTDQQKEAIIRSFKGPRQNKIVEAMSLAHKMGGVCLSETYVTAHTHLIWKCAEGHQWGALLSNILQGTWCPKCAGKKLLSIEEMHAIAAARGGKCLSENYTNNETKLLWECAEGHQWEAPPGTIKGYKGHKGAWCLVCGGRAPLTIEEMVAIAAERGGKCLSDRYVNAHTKLLWECSEGHRWETRPLSIKNKGSWCPFCARKKVQASRHEKKCGQQLVLF